MFLLKKMRIGRMFALPGNFFLFLFGLVLLYWGLLLAMDAFKNPTEKTRWNLQKKNPSYGLRSYLR